MKRALTAIGIFLIAMTIGLYANDDDPTIHFPDSAFKKYLLYNFGYYIDKNEDGEIQVSEAKILNSKKEMHINWGDITDLSGIEYFTNLGKIRIGYLNLDTLDISGMSALWSLYYYDGSVKHLNAEGCLGLKFLKMRVVGLQSANLDNCVSLEDVELYENKLKQLDFSDSPNLELLTCDANKIENIRFADYSKLHYVCLDENNLINLDFSKQPNIEVLHAPDNLLESINFKNGNNFQIHQVLATNNPNLECIEVDDVTWCYANWFSKPDKFQFDYLPKLSEDCSNSIQETECNFEIYPNPATNVLNIRHNHKINSDIRIIDIKGRIYLSHTLVPSQNEYSLDISGLASGTYIIEINNQSTRFIKK